MSKSGPGQIFYRSMFPILHWLSFTWVSFTWVSLSGGEQDRSFAKKKTDLSKVALTVYENYDCVSLRC